MLSIVAFELTMQSSEIATETLWPTQSNIVIVNLTLYKINLLTLELDIFFDGERANHLYKI